jgi:hypothetical protein
MHFGLLVQLVRLAREAEAAGWDGYPQSLFTPAAPPVCVSGRGRAGR